MLQRYRADLSKCQDDGATLRFAHWLGGPTLSKISNCRLEHLAGGMRRTVYITAEPDTVFSVPAVCKIAGCVVKGYVAADDKGYAVFRHGYY